MLKQLNEKELKSTNGGSDLSEDILFGISAFIGLLVKSSVVAAENELKYGFTPNYGNPSHL